MLEKNLQILNRAGLHARPASLLVQTAQGFESSIIIKKGSVEADAKSILNILTLGASYKSEITLKIDGSDENSAMEALCNLIESKFEEN